MEWLQNIFALSPSFLDSQCTKMFLEKHSFSTTLTLASYQLVSYEKERIMQYAIKKLTFLRFKKKTFLFLELLLGLQCVFFD